MKILIYYPKTQKTEIFLAEIAEIGQGGVSWFGRGSSGFIGFCPDYQISIVKE